MTLPDEIARPGLNDLVFAICAFAFLYTQLFQLPFTPIYFDGDVMIPVTDAMRMLDGQTIYRDFFQFVTPGTEVVYAFLFSVFGAKVYVINTVILLLGMAQVGLIWFFSRKLLTGYAVFLPATIFLTVGFRLFGIDGSYRIFSSVFGLAAVAVVMRAQTHRNLMIAGFLCGVSSFFGQQRGVLVVGAILSFLLSRHISSGFQLRKCFIDGVSISAAFLLTILATQSYFVWQAGIDNYYLSVFAFVAEHYRHDPMNRLSAYMSEIPAFHIYMAGNSILSTAFSYLRANFATYFYYLLIPPIYVIFLIWRWLTGSATLDKARNEVLWLLWFSGIFLAIGVAAPTAGRLYQIAIPGLVILVFLLSRVNLFVRVSPVVLSLLAVLGCSYVLQRQITSKYSLQMPAGECSFLNESAYSRYKWIGENTRPGDLLYEAHHPDFYFPFQLKNPTRMSLIRDNEYTPQSQVDSVVLALKQTRPKYIVWPDGWSKDADKRQAGDHLESLSAFIQQKYRKLNVFQMEPSVSPTDHDTFDVWQLSDERTDTTY